MVKPMRLLPTGWTRKSDTSHWGVKKRIVDDFDSRGIHDGVGQRFGLFRVLTVSC
ncbi:hypothetical protein [Corynebacterium ulcerans]|uniref:Uncharacterized protein n=1 Tax=Corynebacterium ulcerans FRC58 TaxID=1408268 RepID=A0ABN4GZ02_CORUL|nr:hypothetical protein [Corynebacterium ulcerans]AKN77852.1 Hypothetical protein CulFRC58_1998 [Corynebacterium ulcerans FRC58]MBH5296457.1 hypothetical protein [Corynebacterium ulcerans]MBH5299101.1 hypothetical protein [Corynebacterium ulcerans]MBH5302199.1 hypothetical protein [Corynebacterium ulcerans]MBL4944716.1 hypothetical protein [Corynebacterium ulcerans]